MRLAATDGGSQHRSKTQTASPSAWDAGPENGVSSGISVKMGPHDPRWQSIPQPTPGSRRPGHIFRCGPGRRRAQNEPAIRGAVDLPALGAAIPVGVICRDPDVDWIDGGASPTASYAERHGPGGC